MIPTFYMIHNFKISYKDLLHSICTMSYSFNQLDKKNNHQLCEIKDEIKSRIKYYEKQIDKLNETLSYTEHRLDEIKDKIKDRENKDIIMKEFVECLFSTIKNGNKPIEGFDGKTYKNKLYIAPPYNQRCILTFFKEWYSMMYPKDNNITNQYVFTYLAGNDFIRTNNELIIPDL